MPIARGDLHNDSLKIGVLGLGTSNLGVIDYLYQRGFRFSLTLRSEREPGLSKIPHGIIPDRIFTGENCFASIDEEYLFLSPSARLDRPEIERARRRGVIISSDVSLFFRQNAKTDVFTVTGTDGKSTTVTILFELLSSVYDSAVLCGNIGRALSPLLLAPPSAAAVELSSFQLMSTAPRSKAALITNISENHLDWHRDFDEYIRAKENILKNAERRITSADSPAALALAKKHGADALFSTEFSDSELARLGAKDRFTLSRGFIMKNGEPLVSYENVGRHGKHNVSNFMGALAMMDCEIDKSTLSRIESSFRPLAHRAEFVGSFGGVDFIDSSIDSTPMRTSITLSSMKNKPVVILCGRGKNLPVAPLLDALLAHSAGAVISGECKDEVLFAISRDLRFKDSGYPIFSADSFSGAVTLAAKLAGRGGTVLLSPAATSYDTFSDYRERGREFARLAAKTAL